jgi:rhomboid protease GluP
MMSPIPMCPGCRAILEAGAKVCPYCGWELERTEVRRHGGTIQRTLRGAGGLPGALLLANIVLYAVTAILDSRYAPEIATDVPDAADRIVSGILSPSGGTLVALGANVPEYVLGKGEWWRLLCPVFLHGSALHIFFNLSSLWNIGWLVEELFGTGKALAIYLLCGIAGSAASVAWFLYTGPFIHDGVAYAVPRIGASGAIIGYVGLLAGLGLRVGGEVGRSVWLPMLKSFGFILVLGIVLSMGGGPFSFDNAAHIGGFVCGFAAGLLCTFGVRARSNPAVVKAWDVAAGVLTLLYAAAFVAPAMQIARDVR